MGSGSAGNYILAQLRSTITANQRRGDREQLPALHSSDANSGEKMQSDAALGRCRDRAVAGRGFKLWLQKGCLKKFLWDE